MLDTEQARLLTLENVMADHFLLVVAIKRQLGALKHYLKISTSDLEAPRYRTRLGVRASRTRQKTKTKRRGRTRRRI
jgi:hypothetical protein